jgi:hypothetical protein
MIDDKDKLIAALKLRLGGQCCEVCWTNSWVPIPSEADANGVNILHGTHGAAGAAVHEADTGLRGT